MGKISGGFYSLTEWITKFAYVNLLWLSFSLLGLILFGIFPSTIAMFTVIRKWMIGQTDAPIFRTFWDSYKKEFLKGNGLGLIIVLVGGLIILDLLYMKHSRGFFYWTHIPIYLFILAVTMTFLYIFPVYVHYEIKFTQMFKNAFLIMLINPIPNIVMVVGVIVTFYIIKFIPGSLFFFGGSLISSIIMAACFIAFKKIDRKREELQAN